MTRFVSVLIPVLAGCAPVSDEPPEPYSDCSAEEGDDYEIATPDGEVAPVRIEGDTLYVWVGHGGGCEQHDYQICWPGLSIDESNPVQIGLDIWHDANGDMCDAYLTEELSFDLTPLKDTWHENYGAGPGVITLHVRTETVEYSFAD